MLALKSFILIKCILFFIPCYFSSTTEEPLALPLPIAMSRSYSRTTRQPSKSNFKTCCALGKLASNSTAMNTCYDYSKLNDRSAGCQYAYTICCNQNKRTNECERGKKHAYSGLPCADLKKDSYCDALTDCCNCCELGILTRKNGDDCMSTPELNPECNTIFMDCCKYSRPCNYLLNYSMIFNFMIINIILYFI